MGEDHVRALQTELASMEETGNPRAEQVRAALAEAGGLPDDAPATPKRRGPGRPRKEDTADRTPKERA